MKKIITISREFGAGGGQIGKAVADRLGYYYLDKDMIIRSAMESSNLTATGSKFSADCDYFFHSSLLQYFI